MPLIVEDGTGVENANTYNSEADAVEYFEARGIVLVGPAYASSLLLAMDSLSHLKYKGSKANYENDLPFPRDDITDQYGNLYTEDTVPTDVRRAQLWLAHYIDNGSNPGSIAQAAIKSEKVDVLETVYAISDSTSVQALTIQDLPNVYQLIHHLIDTTTTTVNSGGVYR